MSAHTPGPWKAVSAAACADIDVMEQLLAALKQAADAFEIASSGGGVNFYQYARELRAAIAKVEGKQ